MDRVAEKGGNEPGDEVLRREGEHGGKLVGHTHPPQGVPAGLDAGQDLGRSKYDGAHVEQGKAAKRLQALDDSGQFFVKDGDAAAALGTAAKVMEAEYTTNINIHAPMEPMNATAEFKGDILHIYSGNQFATRSGAIAAGAAGIDPKFVVTPGSKAETIS